jgi:catechol 2,3-dioxygenase-like lactoylglutathione lyase family enzyme
MSRPKLRHVAFVVRDAAAIAAFYRDQLEMEVFHVDPDGSHFLTDGYINLALIQHQLASETPPGFNHFGFTIEDTTAMSDRLVTAGVPRPVNRPTDRPFAEYRAIDPEGNWFDLSEHGFLPPDKEE